MKLLSIVLLAILLSSCASPHVLSKLSAFKYGVATRQTEGGTRDAEWERIIRLFADHDIPIKMVDKSSGFIESDVMSFINAYAIDGQQNNAGSNPVYVIAQREVYGNTLIQPSYITGQIKIFVLPKDGKIELQVSIENLRNFYTVAHRYSHSSTVNYDEYQRQVSSTGSLENNIADYIILKSDSINIDLLKGAIINPNDNRIIIARAETRKSIGLVLGVDAAAFAVIIPVIIAVGNNKH